MATTRPRPVLFINAVLVFFQLLTAGAAFGDIFGQQFTALMITVIAAAQGASAFYQQSLVTPVLDPRDGQGRHLVPGR